MPTYHVVVTRDATESVGLTLVAPSGPEAEALAQKVAKYNLELQWTVDEGNYHEPYTNGADEIPAHTPKTRADLTTRNAWTHMAVDTSGNPCVWRNYYVDSDGNEWTSDWSCQCDDKWYSPHKSEWVGPSDAAELALWEALPECE